MKRVSIATLSGALCGFVCFSMSSSGSGELPWPAAVQIILSRTLIGFAIGISALSIGHWAVHGIVMGALFSLPLAFSGLMAPDNPEFSKTGMWGATVVMGIIYGLFIEGAASGMFKAKQAKSEAATVPHPTPSAQASGN